MFKETVTYKDFNGNTRTEDLFFNLSKMEMMDLEISTPNGLSKDLEKILADQDTIAMFGYIKTFIAKSYGVKSEDGRRFIKNDAVLEEFIQSAAYDEFITSLITDENKMNSFILGIMPEVPANITEDGSKNEKAELIEKFKAHQASA